MSLIPEIFDAIFHRGRERHAIPVLDGPFSPNNRLSESPILGGSLSSIDDMILGFDDSLYVSSENNILACTGADFSARKTFATFDSEVGGLGWSPVAQRLYACVAGVGLVALDAAGVVRETTAGISNYSLNCSTSVAVASDGSVFVTNGSDANPACDWLLDLMQSRTPSGAVLQCPPDLSDGIVLAKGLAWANGVTVSPDGRKIFFVESWRHSILALDRETSKLETLCRNLPGYPARLDADASGGYWLAMLGLRTELTEFVLRERKFRERMIREVPRPHWIGPALSTHHDFLEPTQFGGIRQLGIQKAWAPPRSYGLVVQFDNDFNPIASFHSRVGGHAHGIVAVRVVGDGRVLIASKGHDRLIELDTRRTIQKEK
jgi:sugar lactone lactonase YvrE